MKSCKNCASEINETDNFCKKCGAKIIKERITLKYLFSNFLTALGWDSNFFTTLRYLLYQPQVVIQEYIGGTRKKYTNPFSFLAIITAVSLFIFSQYSEEFIEFSTNIALEQTESVDSSIIKNKSKSLEIMGYKNQYELQKSLTELQLKYYNLITFLFLPIYTLISFIVFRKPHNYGEHLVINTYVLGITTLISTFLFIFSILIGVNFFLFGVMIIPFFYYAFTYKKLHKLTLGQVILKMFGFIGLYILVIFLATFIGIFSAVITKLLL